VYARQKIDADSPASYGGNIPIYVARMSRGVSVTIWQPLKLLANIWMQHGRDTENGPTVFFALSMR
jgi:hypothetical protein